MSATERIRAMLDERGVEYDKGATVISGIVATFWHDRDGYPCSAIEGADDIPDGEVSFQACVTPEQAIAATLGTGTCHNVNHGLTFVCSECGANVDTASSIGYSYVDEFGKRWYGASNDYGLNYCPNCGRKVVAE